MAYNQPASRYESVGVTAFGCGPHEASLFRQLAPGFRVAPTMTEAPLSEATARLAAGDRCVSVGHKTRITNAALLALSRGGVTYLSTRSVGYDHIDVRYAESVGISVENVAYSPDSVADYTLMLMLMLARHARSVVCRGELHDYRLNDVPGIELRDLTIGVVGTGRIGSAVIARLRGFGGRVLAHDASPKTDAEYVPLETLLRLSDVVTLHTPLTPETRHLLNRDRLAQTKHGALVVNTGRGALIDTEALTVALECGRLGGAALDVVEGEEGIFYVDCRGRTTPFERLHRLPNVIVSPHTAYYTDHALSDIVENTLRGCAAFARGAACAG